MTLPVIVEPQAEADLHRNVAWWAEHRDIDQAFRWYDGIHKAIATLAENPERFVLARENAKSDEELRELHFGVGSRATHRVIYVVDDDAVRVLAVRHAAQEDAEPEELR